MLLSRYDELGCLDVELGTLELDLDLDLDLEAGDLERTDVDAVNAVG